MARFRKKPVEIEALQWTGHNHRPMFEFLGGSENEYLIANGKNFYINHSKVVGGLVIKTLEGEHLASIDDWIIKGVKGEFYPCKPDVFDLTYEPIAVDPAVSPAQQPSPTYPGPDRPDQGNESGEGVKGKLSIPESKGDKPDA